VVVASLDVEAKASASVSRLLDVCTLACATAFADAVTADDPGGVDNKGSTPEIWLFDAPVLVITDELADEDTELDVPPLRGEVTIMEPPVLLL
jgi:hypothetical protein